MKFSLLIMFFAFAIAAEAKTLSSTTSVAAFLKEFTNISSESLIPNNKDPHHYEIKPRDIVKLESATKLYINAKKYEHIKYKQIKNNYPLIEIIFFDELLKSKGLKVENPHFLNSPRILKQLTKLLASDKKQKEKVIKKLNEWQKENKKRLAGRKVYVFHESLDYLFEDLNINKLGQIEKHHGVFPGLGHLNNEIKKNERT